MLLCLIPALHSVTDVSCLQGRGAPLSIARMVRSGESELNLARTLTDLGGPALSQGPAEPTVDGRGKVLVFQGCPEVARLWSFLVRRELTPFVVDCVPPQEFMC